MNLSTPRKLDDFFGGNILIGGQRFRMVMGSRREDSSQNAFTAILVLGIGRVAATKPRIKDIKEQNFAGIRMKFGARAVLESRWQTSFKPQKNTCWDANTGMSFERKKSLVAR